MAKTTITISKTVQAKQYEPVVITITEEHDKLLDDDVREKRARKIGASIKKAMDKELARWSVDDDA